MNNTNNVVPYKGPVVIPRCLTALPANIEEIIKAFKAQIK